MDRPLPCGTYQAGKQKNPKFARTGRSRSTGAHLKPRRAWARDRSRGRSPTDIIQRTPAIILDTRLNDTQNKGTYRCDECEKVFHGPFQGEFMEEARDLSYDELSSGWKHGTVDASWFCEDCWKDKLGIDSVTHTREAIGPPRAARPAAVRDNRFLQHSNRWCLCDNCECYCAGRAKGWLPGSFAYAKDNSLAGPPKTRRGCFPTLHERENLWRNGSWNARFLCRTCLVREWDRKPREIEQWLPLRDEGPAKAAPIQWRLQTSSSGSSWHGGWGGSNQGNWWSHNAGRWR